MAKPNGWKVIADKDWRARDETMSSLPRTRAEAVKRETDRFFTGRACANGHVTWRYANNGNCSQCHNHRAATRQYGKARGEPSTMQRVDDKRFELEIRRLERGGLA